jgi:hypothetical protein
MTKTGLIQAICEINKKARPVILRHFEVKELHDYLKYLSRDLEKMAVLPNLTGE